MQYFIIVFNIFYVSCGRLVCVPPVYFGNDYARLCCFAPSCRIEHSAERGFCRLRNSTLNLPTVGRTLHETDVRNLAMETCIFAFLIRTWETWVAFHFARKVADHIGKRRVTWTALHSAACDHLDETSVTWVASHCLWTAFYQCICHG